MAKTTKQETKTVVTRAEKKDAAKNIIKELLAAKPHKHNELIDEAAKLYAERLGSDGNINDINGRIGSVLDIMKKESEVAYEGGVYALKARMPMPTPVAEPSLSSAPVAEKADEPKSEEKPKKKTARTRAKKTETMEEKNEPIKAEAQEIKEEKPRKTTKKTKAKTEKDEPEKVQPLPPSPLQPIAPVVPVTPEVAPEPIPEQTEEMPAPKKRGRKPKAKADEAKTQPQEIKKAQIDLKEEKSAAPQEKTAETPVEKPVENSAQKPVDEPKAESPKAEIKNPPVVKEKAEIAKKNVVMDMSFLFGEVKTPKTQEKAQEKAEEKAAKNDENKEPQKPVSIERQQQQQPQKAAVSAAKPNEIAVKKEEKQAEKSAKPAQKTGEKNERKNVRTMVKKSVQKPLTAEEKLRESFLKRMRSLGGDYFEYYSVYLLERYSMKNGRRLEAMRVCGGDNDGGVDGEIELTDKFGFKETIYIQAKNWDPEKGDERLWVVGETLLQQFIGACACKQAKEGKQHCRGIFITTSRFTPDAKRILETMSDKIVGYDGEDLFEAAKECEFGLVKKNGEWTLDEQLLSGSKAFFHML